MKINAFITVRTKSSRLPGKCLMKFGEGNVIQHIIRRAKYFKIDPIVCTTNDKSDDVLVDICMNEQVEIFRGSVDNKLKRWLDCCDFQKIDNFHTIDADDPFFDPIQVLDSYKTLQLGYDVVYPTKTSSQGAASVGFSINRKALSIVCNDIRDNHDTEMIWYYFDKYDEIKKSKLNDGYNDLNNVRLTLDYEEDYWLLETVRRILGNNASRVELNNLFKNNPELRLVNWFRNTQWEENQKSKSF